MIGAFVASLLLAAATAAILAWVAYVLRHVDGFGDLLYMLRATVGPVPVIVLTGIVLFVLYFYLFSAETIRYIEQLNRTLDEIARGNLDVTVPDRSPDELHRLADNLAVMSQRLKRSLDEERAAQATKQELITGVSHDLRTPLTSVLGYLALIENDQYRDEVELRHYVGIAYSKGQQLKRLIDQLFEFTRTSYGGVQLRCVPVNLGELLEQLAEEFVPALQATGMAYQMALPPERVMVSLDPDLMVRVFENLMANAVRYGSAGRQVDIELSRAAGELVVKIANYGEPIPSRDLPYVFETFYRVEKSRSDRTGGAGLGLAIAKNIVTLHGGTIRAYNEPNRVVFEVRLPEQAAS
ncbi:MAG: two-component sensor histidine kinase [Symbiobacteriaceae bacterium]|jgi:signal transduction histidine kinase|nr:two-component sensor histidine kinase [Symbiobacteriaceae bacterium]